MDLVGREPERQTLRALLDCAAAGTGGSLVVRGVPGIGLSALLRDARDGANVRVHELAGLDVEAELPFGAVHRLRTAMRGLPDAESPGPDADAFAVGQDVLALLDESSKEQPLALLVDDTQLLDDRSAHALAFAARRLTGTRVAVVFGVQAGAGVRTPFEGIREVELRPLPLDAARELVGASVPFPVEASVRDRIVAAAHGLPLALVELPAQLTFEELSGVSRLPDPLPVGPSVAAQLLAPLAALSEETRMLLLLAAAGPELETASFWRVASSLGIGPEAAAPAEEMGVLRLGTRPSFANELLRLAVYASASSAERCRAHAGIAEAFDPVLQPVPAVRHRAAATLAPDEDVASALERAASIARSARDEAGAADLLERAAELSPSPARANARLLAGAQAAFSAGALGRARTLLDSARADPRDELQQAQAERLRSVIGLARGQGMDRVTMLLDAARAFEGLDLRLARDTYLEAFEAAVYTGRFSHETTLLNVAEAARAVTHGVGEDNDAPDALLDALTMLVTAGHSAAAAALRRAVRSLSEVDEPRWLALGWVAVLELWDEDALHHLARHAERLQQTGTSPATPAVEAAMDLEDVITGRFGVAAGAPLRPTAPWEARSIDPADVLAAAWRGRSIETRELAEACMRDAFTRDLGLHVSAAQHALAVLELGLGRYDAALTAARDACEEPGLSVATRALPDLVEAAVRSGEREAAIAATARLAESARPSGSHWALGLLARCRALIAEGEEAERLHLDAIRHLRASRVAPELARAHLLYGEWLRRERRRREAREELRAARDMFVFMGAQAFAERARLELGATGEYGSRGSRAPLDDALTAQEARIAALASDGVPNAEIAAQLYISPKTVEYHLRKVFRKLDVTSRTQLARALREADHENAPAPGRP